VLTYIILDNGSFLQIGEGLFYHLCWWFGVEWPVGVEYFFVSLTFAITVVYRPKTTVGNGNYDLEVCSGW